MKSAWTATVLIALSVVCVPAAAQSLVDAARRAEESRKANPASAVAFDERDVNPMLAARELLGYEISEQRWKTYVAADDRVMDILEKDLALYDRLEMLRANSARMIERFILREPVLIKALEAAGTDAHEYAFTSVAIALSMAVIASNPDPVMLDRLPDATKANMAFVRAHDAEIRAMMARGVRLKERAAKSAARRSANDTGGTPAAAAAGAAAGTGRPAAAPRLSAFEVDERRWRRFLTADKLVMEAVEKTPRLYEGMKQLNLMDRDPDDAVVALERFVDGEPSLAAAVRSAGSQPQEYAYTQMAITIAATLGFASDVPPGILENAPPAVKANIAFVRKHEREVKDQNARNLAFQQRMETQ